MQLRIKNGNERMVFCVKSLVINRNLKSTQINEAKFYLSNKKSRVRMTTGIKICKSHYCKTTVQQDLDWWMCEGLTNGVAGEL
jgi:hypothetical protein